MLQNRPHNHKVDLWTIGVLAYELVTGKPPFESYTEQETKRKILQRSLEFPSFASELFKDFVKGMLVEEQYRPCIEMVLKHQWLENRQSQG